MTNLYVYSPLRCPLCAIDAPRRVEKNSPIGHLHAHRRSFKNTENDPKKTRQRRSLEENGARRKRTFTPAESIQIRTGGHILLIAPGSLLEETLDADLQAVNDEIEQLNPAEKAPKVKQQPKRQPLPANLPRTDIHHEPDSTTCQCGCQLKRIGEDVAEKLSVQRCSLARSHVQGSGCKPYCINPNHCNHSRNHCAQAAPPCKGQLTTMVVFARWTSMRMSGCADDVDDRSGSALKVTGTNACA